MSSDGRFEPDSEQFLAVVWYAMKDAEKQYQSHKEWARQDGGTNLNHWWYLNKVRRVMKWDRANRRYDDMRRDLAEFAETFGVR